MEELLKREDAYKAELKKERDEVSRLRSELEKAQSRNAELEKSAAEESRLRVDEAQKLKETLDQTEPRATSAQEELQTLKGKADIWLADLAKIKKEMDSKPFLLFYFYLICKVFRHVTYAVLVILFSGSFPHSQPATSNATHKARLRRAESGPI